MQLNQIFDEKVEGNQWILAFREFIWIIPAQIRYNEVLCNELFDLSQWVFSPPSNLLTDAMMPSERSQLLTAVAFDRMIREGLILPAHKYELNNINNTVELNGIYLSQNDGQASILVKLINYYERECLAIHLRNQNDFNLSGFELIVQIHEDCLASVNYMRELIAFLNKIYKEYL